MRRIAIALLLILLGCATNPTMPISQPPAVARAVYKGFADVAEDTVAIAEIDLADMPSVNVYIGDPGGSQLSPLPMGGRGYSCRQGAVLLANCQGFEYQIVVVK